MRFALPLALILALLAGCDRRSDAGPVVVSAIGATPVVADASLGPRGYPDRLLLGATAQGLVGFDAGGLIEPGLAERWIVIDDGMSYIFRLRDAQWGDGRRVTAAQVVAVLRRQIAPASHNPLRPFLSAIDEIVEMTPEVIEVRLKYPRPDLLQLFAQPELAIFRMRPPGGSGPFRIVARDRAAILLRPAADPNRSLDDDAASPGPEANVRLISERAARAIARFAARESDLVAGGSFLDWPLLATARLAPANQRLDPALGLFGLAIVNREGYLAEAANRASIAEAIDREALTGAFVDAWQPATQILPARLDSAAPPAVPAWVALGATERIADARRRVETWRARDPDPLTLRIALAQGPGANLLYGAIRANLHRIGIDLLRVPFNADADLRLIDAVAPYDSGRWYLATACAPCGEEARSAIDAVREAPTMAQRALRIAEADVALAADVAYIPLAQPLRWSLVALRLRQWQSNARAAHPLNHLRRAPK